MASKLGDIKRLIYWRCFIFVNNMVMSYCYAIIHESPTGLKTLPTQSTHGTDDLGICMTILPLYMICNLATFKNVLTLCLHFVVLFFPFNLICNVSIFLKEILSPLDSVKGIEYVYKGIIFVCCHTFRSF